MAVTRDGRARVASARARRIVLGATAAAAVVVPALALPTSPEWQDGRWGEVVAGWLVLAVALGAVPIASALGPLRRPQGPTVGEIVLAVAQVAPPLVMLLYLLRTPADQAGAAFLLVPPCQVALLLFHRFWPRG
jgi:hypothetical protein